MSEFGFQVGGTRQPGLEDLEFRNYRLGDEHAILDTFNLVFRETNGPGYCDRPLEEWDWIYRQNPLGLRIFLAVASDGTVAGQWAGIPVRMQTEFGPQVFVQIVDTLVHPSYRKGRHGGPGVFALVGSQGIEHWMGELGDAALYGYPVPMAEKMGRRFLGYRRLCVVDFLLRSLDGVAAEPALPSGWSTARWSALSPELDELFARTAADGRCLVIRDRTYVQWRYLDRPDSPYEIHEVRCDGVLRGVMVLRPNHELVPGACGIADWIVPDTDREATAVLLDLAGARGRAHGRQSLLAVFPERAREFEALRASGFALVPSAFQMERRLTYFTSPRVPEISDDYLAGEWWYTLGDSDLI